MLIRKPESSCCGDFTRQSELHNSYEPPSYAQPGTTDPFDAQASTATRIFDGGGDRSAMDTLMALLRGCVVHGGAGGAGVVDGASRLINKEMVGDTQRSRALRGHKLRRASHGRPWAGDDRPAQLEWTAAASPCVSTSGSSAYMPSSFPPSLVKAGPTVA